MMYLIFFLFFFLLEMLYFRIADKFNIIDKPNQRSSHVEITLRGGGILFPLAWLCWFFISGCQLPYITLGVVLLAVISFWDDIQNLNSKIRFGAQFVALGLLFFQLQVSAFLPWYGVVAAFALCVGCLNAVNFMDGINGMTGFYGLITFGFIIYRLDGLPLPSWQTGSAAIYLFLALLVFGFFNFRKRAKCFAGDIGSISMGYLMIAYCLTLMLYPQSHETVNTSQEANLLHYLTHEHYVTGEGMHSAIDYSPILFLSVYGIDAMLTIFQRLWHKENILQPHRKHLYQYLANELKWPHLLVSGLYALLQLGINVLVVRDMLPGYSGWYLLIALGIFYIAVKWKIHRSIVSKAAY